MAFFSILDLWNTWNIRGCVMLSLLLQVFLVFCAPLRAKVANDRIIFLLWMAYLMADWVAAFSIGLISHNQGNPSAHGAEVNVAIQAFWASFLLLHLGGPDTITAFSLEDSSLWRRHLLSLIFQVGASIYAFVQMFPVDRSLVIPTMLVFLTAVIKNAERTLALNLSSLPRIREWVISQHRSSADRQYNWPEVPDVEEEEEGKLTESKVVHHAYYFFQIFKVFLGDLMFTERQRNISRDYFSKVPAMDALRVISVELHFMYEMLHTKTLAIHSKLSYIFRFVGFINIVTAFVIFNHLKKHRFREVDVEITYILLFGAIALDVIALFMLVFSDWTVAMIAMIKCRIRGSSKLELFLGKLLSLYNMDDQRKPRFATCEVESNANDSYKILDTPLIFRRWSESISACNLFSEHWKKGPRKMYKCNRGVGIIVFSNIRSFPFRLDEKITSCFHQARVKIAEFCHPTNTSTIAHTEYVSKNPFINKLWIFIIREVRRKSKHMDQPDASSVFEAKGNLFLQGASRDPGGIDCKDLLQYVTGSYDVNILCWHIATELCYIREESTVGQEEKEFSKILSDYMMYLLLKQPNLVSAVAGIAQIISGETLNIMNSISWETYKRYKELPESEMLPKESLEESPLGGGMKLALKLERLGEMKWKVISGVWVEMLSYAATHIRGEAHVQVLSRGGELLAFVWLLMAHLGCFHRPPWGLYYEHRHSPPNPDRMPILDPLTFPESFL